MTILLWAALILGGFAFLALCVFLFLGWLGAQVEMEDGRE